MKKFLIVISLAMLIGCHSSQTERTSNPSPREISPLPRGPQSQLATFSSDEELQQYLVQANHQNESDVTNESTTSPTSAEPSPADSNSEITNNQEAGVDEGGVVKNYRDFLLVLRHGRLVSARIGDDKTLQQIDLKEVTPEGLGNLAWYDELLVHESLAIVIGYRYGVIPDYASGATELNLFQISEDGHLSRKGTYFVESGDYYSWRNYTGRMIDGKFVFHTPYYANLILNTRGELGLPKAYRYDGPHRFEPVGDLFSATDVARPDYEIKWPVLHSVIQCDLSETFACHAKVVMASFGSEYYVSSKRAYLFANGEMDWELDPLCSQTEPMPGETTVCLPRQVSPNLLYVLELDNSGSGVTAVTGSPSDQFSFDESSEGISLVTSIFSANRNDDCHAYLVTIPFTSFGRAPAEPQRDHYFCLSRGEEWLRNVRFHKTYLAAGSDHRLILVHRDTKAVSEFPLTIVAERIELAGADFMVVGSRSTSSGDSRESGNQLIFQLVRTTPEVSLGDSYEMANTRQGEWRSHGYFFHRGSTFNTFAIATFNTSNLSPDSYSLWPAEASLNFFNISSEGLITGAGQMTPQSFQRPAEECATSCVDWYGNTRPIFLGDTIIGLLGDQMSLGALDARGNLHVERHLNLMTGEVL